MSLADARELALANRKVARSGGDPLANQRQSGGVPTFADAVEKVIAIHSGIWRHPEKTKQQWRECLRDHAYTRIGDKGVDKVTTADVMAVLLPLWTRRHATARKLRQRIGAVMKWAVAQGYRTDNPTGDALTAALPKRAHHVRHMPALPHEEVADAVEAVRASSAWIGPKLCFEFMVLTAVRPGEARGARWEEIDLGASVWTIRGPVADPLDVMTCGAQNGHGAAPDTCVEQNLHEIEDSTSAGSMRSCPTRRRAYTRHARMSSGSNQG